MHRGRFGGNARKRKAKLTDDTFHAMIRPTALAEPALATLETADADVVERETVVVFTEDLAIAATHRPVEYAGDIGVAEPRTFRCQDYQFGYTVCPTCHSDQVFYLHQADLERGVTFRCRICRHELTVSTQD